MSDPATAPAPITDVAEPTPEPRDDDDSTVEARDECAVTPAPPTAESTTTELQPIVVHLAQNEASQILARQAERSAAEQELTLLEAAARALAETPVSLARTRVDLAGERVQSAALLAMARRGLNPDLYTAHISDTGVTFRPKDAPAPSAPVPE